MLNVILIFTLAFLLWRKQTAELKRIFCPALAVKLVAGICLGLLYTYYFPVADTFVYFNDASRVAELARKDLPSYLELLFLDRNVETLSLTFQEPRALFLTKLTSIFNILTEDNYWISGLYFSFTSFLAAWCLVKTIARYIPSVTLAAVIAFLFFPSVVFWTSGMLKESLAMAALFFLVAVFLKIWFDRALGGWEYALGILSLVVFWNLKYYYVAVFVPVAFTSLFYRFLVENRVRAHLVVRALIWCGIIVLPLLVISFLHPNFNADRILGVIVTNNAAYNQFSDPGDYVRFNDVRATPLSILINAPWAIFSGLFRPMFWEAQTIVQFVAGLENTFLLVLFIGALFRVKRILASPHRLLIASLLVFVVLLCVFITISAPNFGTLSRYRVGYLAFFVFLILCDNPVAQYLERSFSRLVSH
jgi:hypothetical protein